MLDFNLKLEKKAEFIKVIKNEVLPILRKQAGFLEILPFVPENLKEDKWLNISLWATKLDAERYEREFYPKVLELLKPYLTTPITVKLYTIETTLCEHFEKALVA
jgi:hypothetical protein